MRRSWLLLVLARATACNPNTPTRPTASGKPTPISTAAATPAPSGAPTGPLPAPPAPLVSGDPPPVLPAAALVGKVKAPAALLGSHAGIISDNGGGVISNNGSSLKLLQAGAPQQVPAVGVTVRVLDAGGQPVNGPDGKPLEAPTDAAGNYRFASLPADHNLVLQVGLETGGGLTAVAPRSSKATDVDLVSTLTTTYILDRYVASQLGQDPVQILDKLPADVEADTRDKAAAALAGGKVPLPDSLAASKVVATVESLRKGDGSFDAQLEAVRKLLIVAGLSNLGAGLPGTDVDIPDVARLLVGPAEALYIVTARRVWRLTPEGRLAIAYDGQEVAPIADAAFDAAGKLWILEANPGQADPLRVLRQGEDGTFARVGTLAGGKGLGLWPEKDGSVTVMVGGAGDRLWSLSPGSPARQLASLPSGSGSGPTFNRPLGRLPDGSLVGRGSSFGEQILVLPPGGSKFEARFGLALVGTQPAGVRPTSFAAMDQDGDILALDEAGKSLVAYTGDGKERALGQKLPDDIPPVPSAAHVVAVTAEDTAYVAGAVLFNGAARWLVFRIQDGKTTLLAGRRPGAPPAARADALPLHAPTAVVAGADGASYVLDSNKVLRVSAEGAVTALATGAGFESVPPRQLRGDKAGNLYYWVINALKGYLLYRLGADGQAAALEKAVPESDAVVDLAVAPDGRLALVTTRNGGSQASLLLGPPEALQRFPLPAPGRPAFDPNGTLYLGFPDRIERVAADGKTSPAASVGVAEQQPFAIDARGRFYIARGNQVERHDPAARTTRVLAGPGGALFAGSGVDDGLGTVADLALAADDMLLILDAGNKQLKRIPTGEP